MTALVWEAPLGKGRQFGNSLGTHHADINIAENFRFTERLRAQFREDPVRATRPHRGRR